jgi:anthranilate phosphoribosyltransferase
LIAKKQNYKKQNKNMKQILNTLFEHQTLSYEEAKKVLYFMAEGKYNESEMAAFLTVYIMRGISTQELKGFRDALLELCIRVNLEDFNTIDLCGTGGDGKNTFNISTLSSFVVAGAGYKVTKHGNYGVSSVSGSSNMLEYFGYKFTNETDKIKKQLDKSGISFLHAPLFHPAMKAVGPVRRNLKVKTFFNMLGPMVNPAFPKNQIVGVFNLEVARQYSYLYQDLDKNFMIIHALDGYDEVSLTGNTKIISNLGERIISPEELGFAKVQASQIEGGNSVEEAAVIFMNVLENKATVEEKNVVLANSALAIQCIDPKLNYSEALDKASFSLKNGQALQSFKLLIEN